MEEHSPAMGCAFSKIIKLMGKFYQSRGVGLEMIR